MKISDYSESYLESITADSSRRTTSIGIKNFISFAGDIKILDITTELLEQWRVWLADSYLTSKKQHLRSSTQITYIALVSGFLNWVWKVNEFEQVNPVKKFSWKPLYEDNPYTRRPRPMQPDDYLVLLKTAKERKDYLSWATLALFASSGMRVESLCTLTMDRLNLSSRTAVVIQKGKRIKTREGLIRQKYNVVFDEDTASILDEYIRMDRGLRPEGFVFRELKGDKRYGGRKLNQNYKKLANLCGITGPHNCHSLRHMFIIERLKVGMPITHISQLVGHSSTAITEQIYGKFTNVNDLLHIYDSIKPTHMLTEK